MKKKRKIASLKTPWSDNANDVSYELNRTINSLLKETDAANKDKNRNSALTQQQQDNLIRLYKKSGHTKNQSYNFMQRIAEHLGIEANADTYIAPTKDWKRASKKSTIGDRDLHDLNRGRILLSTIGEYKKLILLFKKMDKEGYIKDINSKSVRVIPDKIDDYIKTPRKSGFSGTVNFDLSCKDVGTFEVQAIPKCYLESDRHSHRLYDMIRILEEIPESFRTREQTKVKIALIRANRALFDEDAYRSGFIELRKKGNNFPTKKTLTETNDILDRISQGLGNPPSQDWAIETRDAIAFAKTSMANLYIARLNNEDKLSLERS